MKGCAGEPFAGFRALASNGLDLPVLNVFRMFGRMSGQRLPVTSSASVALEEVLQHGIRAAPDVSALAALSDGKLVMPPVVVTELLSDPLSGPILHDALVDSAVLVTLPGFWERAGVLRRKLRARGLKAALADTLIAQSCIDHQAPLITYHRDFRHFVKAGLKLL